MKKIEKKVVKEVKNEMKHVARAVRPKNFIKFRDVSQFAEDAYNVGKKAFNHPVGRLAIQLATGMNLNGERNSVINSATPTVRSNYRYLSAAPKFKGFTGGLRIVASQHFTKLGTVNAQAPLLNNGASNSLPLSPDAIGGAMATDARNYNRYIFRELTFEFVPNTTVSGPSSATNALQYAFAYTADAEANTFASHTFDTIQSVKDSMTTQTWCRAALPVKPLGDILYYTEIDSASSASLRMTEQGCVFCDLPANANATQANLVDVVVHYVMDLYDRSMDYGFTISISGQSNKEVLMSAYKAFGKNLSARDLKRLQYYLTQDQGQQRTLDSLISDVDSLIASSDFIPLKVDETDNKSSSSSLSSSLSRQLPKSSSFRT